MAALLLLAGVAEDAVVADYRATAANIAGVLARLSARGALSDGWDLSWAATPSEAIALVIDTVSGHPDGPRVWFLAHGATDAAVDRFLRRIRSTA